MKTIKLIFLNALILVLAIGCGSTASIIRTPIENIDNTPIKFNKLSKAEEQKWSHLDLKKDTILGMSVDLAYSEIIKAKKGKTVIVAVIDSGIDIDHEDLDAVIWSNTNEIPNNGKDDDNNGYIDDIHGWNFLGDTYNEQLEYVRLLASGDKSNARYIEAEAKYEKELQKATAQKAQYEQILYQLNISDKAIAVHLNKKEYTLEEVSAIKTEREELLQYINVIKQVFGFGFDMVSEAREEISGGVDHFTESLDFNLNKSFKGRKTGDDPDNFSEKKYGNANVKPSKKEENHGTHVAGIIAAERNNSKGMKGIANNVKIMVLRAVPNGDEYDKDIALAIRYAVNNGAKIINTSFGKSYSPHSDWVRDAITYASQKDVLIVNAAGNEGVDLDKKNAFPNDAIGVGTEVSTSFVNVGATEPKYGSGMVASFSNYGKINVDVFAPGTDIYSTTPNNEYKSQGGTSMAAPAVAGVAALIRSYYPNLSASEVKQILMKSGLPIKAKVIVGDDPNNVKPFGSLSKSAKLVNAYNALILAELTSKLKR